jgi:hypothetical protein
MNRKKRNQAVNALFHSFDRMSIDKVVSNYAFCAWGSSSKTWKCNRYCRCVKAVKAERQKKEAGNAKRYKKWREEKKEQSSGVQENVLSMDLAGAGLIFAVSRLCLRLRWNARYDGGIKRHHQASPIACFQRQLDHL